MEVTNVRAATAVFCESEYAGMSCFRRASSKIYSLEELLSCVLILPVFLFL